MLPTPQYPIDPNYKYDQSLSTGATNLQPMVNGSPYYAPVQFQGGYLNLDPTYNPNTNPYAFTYESSPSVNPYGQQGQQLVYGSQTNQLPGGGAVGQAMQTVNGVNAPINQGGAYNPPPYQPTYSQPAAPQSTQTTNPWSGYQFGNNGSQGSIQGSFGQGYNGPTTFFQNEPQSLTQSPSGLGTFQPWNPALQALQQSRGQ